MRSKEQLCGDNQKILSTSFRHFIQLKQYTISTLGGNLKQILDVVTVPIVLKKLFETMLIFCLRMTLIAGTYYTWTQSVKMYELKTAKLNTQASRTTHYTQDGPSLCLQKKLYKNICNVLDNKALKAIRIFVVCWKFPVKWKWRCKSFDCCHKIRMNYWKLLSVGDLSSNVVRGWVYCVTVEEFVWYRICFFADLINVLYVVHGTCHYWKHIILTAYFSSN